VVTAKPVRVKVALALELAERAHPSSQVSKSKSPFGSSCLTPPNTGWGTAAQGQLLSVSVITDSISVTPAHLHDSQTADSPVAEVS